MKKEKDLKPDKPAVSRRDFLTKTSLAIGSFYIVPRHILGKGFVAPSDKLNIAGVGIGGKGYSDLLNSYNNGANNVVALCDVDPSYGPVAEVYGKFPKVPKFKDFRKMLDQIKDIDALTISTPDHTHAIVAMAAMQLGKHVYVQKPLSHNIYEARIMTETARKQKVVTQMGNQGASCNEQVQIQAWVNQGIIGDINTVNVWTNRPVWPQGIAVPTGKYDIPDSLDWDLWIGPAPMRDYHPKAYHAFKWRGWWDFGTGALGDMGCHLIDPPFKALGLGYPTEVQCSVGSVFEKDWVPEYFPESCPPSSAVELKFPATSKTRSDVKMTWMDGGIRPFFPDLIPPKEILGGESPTNDNGFMIIGTKGIITGGLFGMNAKVFLKNGDKLVVDKSQNKLNVPEYGHQLSWVEACKAGFNSPAHKALTSSFDYSGPLTETVLMGNLAIRAYQQKVTSPDGKQSDFLGRFKLLWDGPNMKITNYDAANLYVSRQYREGWKLV
jgi:predicted dehydrogenase